MRILVAGATGYVGSRLVPRLLQAGHDVVVLTRAAANVSVRPWADDVQVEVGDATDSTAVTRAMTDVDTVVDLVHAMEGGIDDFRATERRMADTIASAADLVGIGHIVYLGGLVDPDDVDGGLSAHMASRVDSGRRLAAWTPSVTELRASVVLGAGSASYELIRFVASTPFPIVLHPSWATGRCQPIGIGDLLDLLVAAVVEGPTGDHRIVEVGGPATGTYPDLVDVVRDLDSGLPTVQARVPTVLPRATVATLAAILSPVDPGTVAPLLSSLSHDSVLDPSRGHEVAVMPTTVVEAVRWALANDGEYGRMPGDPDWVGAVFDADLVAEVVGRLPGLPRQLLPAMGADKVLSKAVDLVLAARA